MYELPLTVWITGDLEKQRIVYFIEQFPVFTIHVENMTEQQLKLELRIAFSYQRTPGDHHDYERCQTEIELSKTERIAFEPDMLPYQGPAMIGFWDAGYGEVQEQDEGGLKIKLQGGSIQLTPLYTFMVYDRDFYEVNLIVS